MKSIKQKMMLIVCLICLVLIAMVLVFANFLLEPTYTAMVKSNLSDEMAVIVGIINDNGLMNEEGNSFLPEASTLIAAQITDGQCLEVSNLETGIYIGGLDRIANCTLHTERGESAWSEIRSFNNMLVLKLRVMTAESGHISTEVINSSGDKQYVVGCSIEDENIIILLSSSMERISQAADIIQRQMVSFSALLLAVAMIMAWFFARWFTKPITSLSQAAREMTKGNYKIQVPVRQKDEIGILTQDFNTMAQEVSRTDTLQRDLLANVSHDLRTPLTLIKGYAETIRDLNGDDKQKRDAQLNIIIGESDRLSALVGSVLELSRLSAGTEKFNPVTFDISDFCEEISYRYTDTCEKNGCHIKLEVPGERLITADPDLMSRVLHNLISNALAHVGEDGLIILRVSDVETGVLVEVEDHGIGIPKDEVGHIFQRYYRARQSNGKPGTGLGLSIVRAILVTHQFPFGVRSTEGQGSTFWFIIKRVAAEPGKKTLPAKAGGEHKKPMWQKARKPLPEQLAKPPEHTDTTTQK